MPVTDKPVQCTTPGCTEPLPHPGSCELLQRNQTLRLVIIDLIIIAMPKNWKDLALEQVATWRAAMEAVGIDHEKIKD